MDIASCVQTHKLPVKRITFLWIVKNTSWVSWISTELSSAAETHHAVGIELDIRVHVTCDDDFTTGVEDGSNEIDCDCECDKSLGPCCCINVDEGETLREIVDEKGTKITKTVSKSSDTQVKVQSKTSSTSSSLKSEKGNGVRSRILPCARFYSGRPNLYELLWERLERAEGETGVAVCGPLGLSSDVRRSVVKCSDERGVHKGTGAEGVYLHAECFGW